MRAQANHTATPQWHIAHQYLRLLVCTSPILSRAAPGSRGTPASHARTPPPRRDTVNLSLTSTLQVTTHSQILLASPFFSPKESSSSSGLDLLAQAAGSIPTQHHPTSPHTSHLFSSGPFNPAASLPPKLVKKILEWNLSKYQK